VSVEVFRWSAVSSTPNVLSLIHAFVLPKDSKCDILELLHLIVCILEAQVHDRYLAVAPAAVTRSARGSACFRKEEHMSVVTTQPEMVTSVLSTSNAGLLGGGLPDYPRDVAGIDGSGRIERRGNRGDRGGTMLAEVICAE
jgi:hypothetical protein